MAPNPVGAVLARDKGTSVWQAGRVIVHRGQAPLPQEIPFVVGAGLARETVAEVWQANRVIVHREQASLQQRSPNLYEVPRMAPNPVGAVLGLGRIRKMQALRSGRHNASSFHPVAPTGVQSAHGRLLHPKVPPPLAPAIQRQEDETGVQTCREVQVLEQVHADVNHIQHNP